MNNISFPCSRLLLLLTTISISATTTLTTAAAPYTNATYGFTFNVPDGWTVTETNFYIAHYSDGVLTVNNTRPGLALSLESGSILKGIQPGEIYISFALGGGPFLPTMRPDTVATDIHSLLTTNGIRTFSREGVIFLELDYFKRGQHWQISAALREPRAAENRQKFLAMLESLRFYNAPVANAAWAESLAWRELPDQIRAGVNQWFGWPVVNRADEGSREGNNSVRVKKTASGYAVTFILEAVGSWEYTVAADGTVQAGPQDVYPISPPPAKLPWDLPGKDKGAADVFWIDPYVQECDALGKKTVTWFNEDGSVQRQAPVGDVVPGSGLVQLSMSNHFAVQGLNEDWRITPRPPLLGPNGGEYGTVKATRDSRVFIDQFAPEHGKVGLDVYIHGRRVNSIGPFLPCYPSAYFELNEDGSACLLVLKDESRTTAQIVALNSNGIIQFQTDCGLNVMDPIVAPNGAGVLLRHNGTNANTFMWFTQQGKLRSREINFNPECIGWVPVTRKSLFWTSWGNSSNRCELIDWDTGNELWNIPAPGDSQPLAVSLTSDFILFSVQQPARPDSPPHIKNSGSADAWIRVFYAVNVADGKIAAQWQAQLPHRMSGYYNDHFVQLGGKLFFVTAEEFTELNLEDIRAKSHGWK